MSILCNLYSMYLLSDTSYSYSGERDYRLREQKYRWLFAKACNPFVYVYPHLSDKHRSLPAAIIEPYESSLS